MAIFGVIELEDLVQVSDKTRINCTKSFVSKDNAAVTLVRIEPEAGYGFVTVTGTTSRDWFLDWQYSSAGTKTVSLEITAGGPAQVFTKTIQVVLPATDGLWSKDSDLLQYESDILKWVPEGKSSFTNVHRQAQSLILDWLDHIRVWRDDGTRLEKQDLIITSDVKQLSVYWTLYLIFQSLSNKPDDVFAQKASKYKELMEMTKSRGRIQADLDGSETLESNENTDMKSFRMIRR